MYDTYQRRVAECGQELQKHLRVFADTVASPVKEELPPKREKQNKNNPHFHLAEELQRVTGVDLTRIDGVDVMVAQTVISESGTGHESMENRGTLCSLGRQINRFQSFIKSFPSFGRGFDSHRPLKRTYAAGSFSIFFPNHSF